MNVYLVTAYRWGNREKHSYPVSIRSSLTAALDDAEREEEWRGGKYVCEVLDWELNQCVTGGDYEAKTIKPLPERTIQQMMADLDRGAMPVKESEGELRMKENTVRVEAVIRLLLDKAYYAEDSASPDDGAQLVDGKWYMPVWGCDTLQYIVDGVRALAQPLDGKK